MSEFDPDKVKILYSEKPVSVTVQGLVCSCGTLMLFYTVHRKEREGSVSAQIYVCPKCNNEGGIKREDQ